MDYCDYDYDYILHKNLIMITTTITRIVVIVISPKPASEPAFTDAGCTINKRRVSQLLRILLNDYLSAHACAYLILTTRDVLNSLYLFV